MREAEVRGRNAGKTAEANEWEKAASSFPEDWTDVGHVTPREELPIVVGVVGSDGKVRVNEADLEPGRYRVRAGAYGEIVGEISVLDPVVVRKTNRHERRQNQQLRRYKLPPHVLGGLQRRR